MNSCAKRQVRKKREHARLERPTVARWGYFHDGYTIIRCRNMQSADDDKLQKKVVVMVVVVVNFDLPLR